MYSGCFPPEEGSMSRIRAIATGAAVAVCLATAGQFFGAAGQQMAGGTTAGATGMYAQVPADLDAFMKTVKQVVVRLISN
jgi:hypothetical protein